MSYTALIVVLVLTLLFLIWSILKLSMLPKKKPSLHSATSAGGQAINIQVRRESDGIHLVIPNVVPMDDGPDSIFPDIINEAEPDTHGLSVTFWERVASMPDIEDPEVREKIAQALADAGRISQEDVPAFALLRDDAPPQEMEREFPEAEQHESPEAPSNDSLDETRDGPDPDQIPEPDPDIPPPPISAPPAYEGPAYSAEEKKSSSNEDDFVNRKFNF